MKKLRRLDQLLGALGYVSRRDAGRFLRTGAVCVDGVPARSIDQRVEPEQVTVDGEPLEAVEGLLAVLHKPAGYICTHAEDEGAIIYDLLPARWQHRTPPVTSVGRLDKDTTGVLLLTDQGRLIQHYTSPRSTVEKVYLVTVDHDLSEELVPTFAAGTLMLRSEDKPCLPAKLEILSARQARLTIVEGRYHQVRRMFASQGWEVSTLHRERFGPYDVADIPPGEWRLLPVPEA